MKNLFLLPAAFLLALAPTTRAEEGGSAHYLPGMVASFMDAFPGEPGGFAVLNDFVHYNADVPMGRRLPLGGLITSGMDASVTADSIVGIYQPRWEVLKGNMAFGLSIPFVYVEVDAHAQRIRPDGTPGPVFSASDDAAGLGDMLIYPFMIGWTNIAPDLKLDVRLGVTAPTGQYEAGRLANVGKNYWTFEPGIMASWLSSKIGTEVSLYTGIDVNTENEDTDYTSGSSLHFDLTIAQHLPLAGGFVGIGANGFYYQQITGDSGSGAYLGGFEGMTLGIGPVLSYVREFRAGRLFTEVKWLPELDVDNRMEGDYLWFKLGFLF